MTSKQCKKIINFETLERKQEVLHFACVVCGFIVPVAGNKTTIM